MERVGEPRLLQALGAHRGEVTCADACGARLASGGGDRTLRLWRWSGGTGWAEEAAAKQAHRSAGLYFKITNIIKSCI